MRDSRRNETTKMWGVCYFDLPNARWCGRRLYGSSEEAVAGFIKLAQNEDVGAVRLYEPGVRDPEGYLWQDSRPVEVLLSRLMESHLL